MTRKRFIKLLMAQGVTRNDARAVADFYNQCNIPYEKAYENYHLENKMKMALEKLSDACRKAGESIRILAHSLESLTKGLVNINQYD